ncbi:disulfide bond formation protein B [Neptuniibacter sp. CAU 1671]|uniref:disulfide bond formation protein B n=1 Tax=Neptuniibacter sp. CAU 1671 TaxID=3032593 RepID=UPI0023DBBEEA|nr:disulfide bond formation protein B [Neptuniibacter sp. CAU 1671]MDF2181076.1 disulfide bond formation protein B [Neptuniibacter sp. CAU 1671]
MLQKLQTLSHHAGYWLLLIVLCVAMEGVALYYQYGLDYGPCVLCIHIRIWIAALLLISVVGLFLRHCPVAQRILHPLTALVALGLAERSYQTLGVERGWIEGSCSFDTGLPAWFALDKWWPQVFEPWETCGYTPELLFGITMAEALMAFSVVLMIISLTLSAVQFRCNKLSQ